MLYVADPFVPIFRCVESLPKRLMRCKCWDIERLKWLEYTFEWDAISGDDAGELARVLLAPTTYQPTIEEFRWWVDANSDRRKKRRG
jgi:hypothetical protein